TAIPTCSCSRSIVRSNKVVLPAPGELITLMVRMPRATSNSWISSAIVSLAARMFCAMVTLGTIASFLQPGRDNAFYLFHQDIETRTNGRYIGPYRCLDDFVHLHNRASTRHTCLFYSLPASISISRIWSSVPETISLLHS